MAACRGILQGSRGTVSRLGGMRSGVKATLNTWTRKVSVRLGGDGAISVEITGKYGGKRVNYFAPAGDGPATLKLANVF